MKVSTILVVVLILPGFASAQAKSQVAATTLQKSNAAVNWNVSLAQTADVDCDDKLDTVMLGSEKGKVVVGIVWGSPAKQPQILMFPLDSGRQDGFCSNPNTIKISPLSCESSNGPLSGCKVRLGCKEFSVLDNQCDPFNFYWDSSRSTLAWWRQ